MGRLAVQGGPAWLTGPVEVVGQRCVCCRVPWVDAQDFRQPGETLFDLTVAHRPLPEFPANGHIAGCVMGAQLESPFDAVFGAQLGQPGLTLRSRFTSSQLRERDEIELMPVAVPRRGADGLRQEWLRLSGLPAAKSEPSALHEAVEGVGIGRE